MGPFTIVHHPETGFVTVYLAGKAVFDITFSHSAFKGEVHTVTEVVRSMIDVVNKHSMGQCTPVNQHSPN